MGRRLDTLVRLVRLVRLVPFSRQGELDLSEFMQGASVEGVSRSLCDLETRRLPRNRFESHGQFGENTEHLAVM